MQMAMDNGIRTIAFPSISTGIYHFPVELAAKIAVHTVARFLNENEGKFDLVEWVLFDEDTERIYEAEVDRLYREIYIQTGKVKDVSKQIHANPKVEICAFKNGEWLRVAGELVEDDRREARQSMLDVYPSLQNMYSADDGNTEVFYFKNATATFSSFTHEPEVVKF